MQSVRVRLRIDAERHGERARRTRSYQRLEHSISPEALRATWPNADVDAALEE